MLPDAANAFNAIRPARVADFRSIISLARVFHSEHVRSDAARWTVTPSPPAVYDRWLTALLADASAGAVRVAEIDGAVVGYALAQIEAVSPRHWAPASVYLHDLYVAPTHRRGGLGDVLLQSVLEWRASHHPAVQLRLMTAADNEAGRAFFAKHGFRACVVEMLRD